MFKSLQSQKKIYRSLPADKIIFKNLIFKAGKIFSKNFKKCLNPILDHFKKPQNLTIMKKHFTNCEALSTFPSYFSKCVEESVGLFLFC